MISFRIERKICSRPELVTSIVDEHSPPLLIAGPCVIEDESETIRLAERISALPVTAKFMFVFKASYLKDNRSSGSSYRGPGLEEGLRILEKVRDAVGCPVLSDVHSVEEAEAAAGCSRRRPDPRVSVPADEPPRGGGEERARGQHQEGTVPVAGRRGSCHREGARARADETSSSPRGARRSGTTISSSISGGFPRMKAFGCPVIFDATHSLQRPGSLGDRSGGEPELAGAMSRAAAAIPCDGLFVETHFDPARARSDGASMLPFSMLESVLEGAYGGVRGRQTVAANGSVAPLKKHRQDTNENKNGSGEERTGRGQERDEERSSEEVGGHDLGKQDIAIAAGGVSR